MAAFSASGFFDNYKQKLLTGTDLIDFDADTIKARLCTSADVPDQDTDDFINDVTAYSGTTDQTVGYSSATDGAFKSSAASITFSSVTLSGAETAPGVVIYKDTGNAATSPVVCYIKFTAAITPNGGDITITWDTSPDYIFKL